MKGQRELVAIERKEGVTIYGRVINNMNKLGQFEVHSATLGNNGHVYADYKEAERRRDQLIEMTVKQKKN
ncbi:MAG TPA: hypothetical protein VFV86_00160 [Nitrososphaeraceae archaeon]|nr:hypothetical protein [Nitrososphaeraceae archaeon]